MGDSEAIYRGNHLHKFALNHLHKSKKALFSNTFHAGIAQLVEQLICNQSDVKYQKNQPRIEGEAAFLGVSLFILRKTK